MNSAHSGFQQQRHNNILHQLGCRFMQPLLSAVCPPVQYDSVVGIMAACTNLLSGLPGCTQLSRQPPPAAHSSVLQAQGLRPSMEDTHFTTVLHPELVNQPAQHSGATAHHKAEVAAAAVFDGHAGSSTAEQALRHTPQLLQAAVMGQHGTAGRGESTCRAMQQARDGGTLYQSACCMGITSKHCGGYDRWMSKSDKLHSCQYTCWSAHACVTLHI